MDGVWAEMPQSKIFETLKAGSTSEDLSLHGATLVSSDMEKNALIRLICGTEWLNM